MGWLGRLRRRMADDRGVTAVEYGLIIGTVGILAVGGLLFLRDSSSQNFQNTTAGTGVCVGAGCDALSTLDAPAFPAAPVLAAPTVATNAATSVSSSAATLSATVNANNAVTSALSITYGTVESTVNSGGGTPISISPTSVGGNTDTAVSGSVAGLSPNTTYYFRASATNSEGTTDGLTLSFTTSAIVTSAPSVTTNPASDVDASSATLSATVNANNAVTSALSITYGTVESTVNSGGGTPISISPTSVGGNTDTAVSGSVAGLSPNTTYYFRAAATNSEGTTDGLTLSFTTGSGAPVAVVEPETDVTASSATLNGTVTANGAAVDVGFCHSTTNSSATCTPWSSGSPATAAGTTATSVSRSISGLAPNTTYYYWVRATRGSDVVTSTSSESFTTDSGAPTVAVDAASGVSAASATLNGSVTANGSSVDVEFCYSTSNNLGSCTPWSAGTPATAAGVTPTSVSRTVSGLDPSTTYYYWVRATRGAVTTTSTPAATFTTTAPACATGQILTPQYGMSKGESRNVFTLGSISDATMASAPKGSNSSVTLTYTSSGVVTWTWSGGSGKTTTISFSYTSTSCTGTGTGSVVFSTTAGP